MGLAIGDRKDLEQQSIGKTELAEFPAMGENLSPEAPAPARQRPRSAQGLRTLSKGGILIYSLSLKCMLQTTPSVMGAATRNPGGSHGCR